MKKISKSFSYASQGIIQAFKTERNLRVHFTITVFILALGLLLGVTELEMLVLFLTITLVIIMELLNTALEEIVDLISPNYSEKAKIAKNVAAGAVLAAAINSVIVGLLIFVKYLPNVAVNLAQPSKIREPFYFIVVVIAAMFVIFVLKLYSKERIILTGGMPSGHSALAFSLATISAFLTSNIFSIIIAYLLATLVAQSRVEGGIHTFIEVVWGGILGVSLTLLFTFFC